MRWHPLIIKWCLYLRHLSGKAYETVRSSGCIRLPSQRTLRDYTHYVSAATGFSTAIDKQLAAAADIDNCSEKDKYTLIVMDEMYIKEAWSMISIMALLLVSQILVKLIITY